MWGQGPVIEQRPRRTRGHTERAALFSTKNAVTRGQKARQTLGGRDSSRGPGASGAWRVGALCSSKHPRLPAGRQASRSPHGTWSPGLGAAKRDGGRKF